MKSEDEYRLSFYQECGVIDGRHNVTLVQHAETGRIYVRKEIYDYDLSVYNVLKRRHFTGIPEIIECVEDIDHHRLIVIEKLINGMTLRNMLDNECTLDEDRVISLLVSICNVLEPLHKCDPPIVHRDIKPENILLSDDSRLFIIDFNASKSVKEGQPRDTELIGTRKYAAPEQYGYSQSDPRTDIYAIGKVGLEMLTGDTTIPNDNINSPLVKILCRCTSMDPADRFSSVSELRGALLSVNRFNPLGKFSRFALPGFRTNILWRKIAAVILYIALFAYILSIDLSGYSIKVRVLTYLCIIIMLTCLILFYGNYLDIHQYMPLMKSKKIPVRIVGYMAYTYLILGIIRIFFNFLGLPADL